MLQQVGLIAVAICWVSGALAKMSNKQDTFSRATRTKIQTLWRQLPFTCKHKMIHLLCITNGHSAPQGFPVQEYGGSASQHSAWMFIPVMFSSSYMPRLFVSNPWLPTCYGYTGFFFNQQTDFQSGPQSFYFRPSLTSSSSQTAPSSDTASRSLIPFFC